MRRFLFVGERPSHKAIELGATWQNGKLAAKQLHDALRALDIDPAKQYYLNLWRTPGVGPINEPIDGAIITAIYMAIAEGYTVVGMGHLVSRALSQHGITHLLIVHPAARGAIRKKERYTAHVGAMILEAAQ